MSRNLKNILLLQQEQVTETQDDDTEDDSNKKVPKISSNKRKKAKPKNHKITKKSVSKVKLKSKSKKSDLNSIPEYEDENIQEVAVRLKKGCDCSENCMRGNFNKLHSKIFLY